MPATQKRNRYAKALTDWLNTNDVTPYALAKRANDKLGIELHRATVLRILSGESVRLHKRTRDALAKLTGGVVHEGLL